MTEHQKNLLAWLPVGLLLLGLGIYHIARPRTLETVSPVPLQMRCGESVALSFDVPSGARLAAEINAPDVLHAEILAGVCRLTARQPGTAEIYFTAGKAVSSTYAVTVVDPDAPQVRGTLVASKSGHTYHLESCNSAQRIKTQNRITFSSEADAKSQGYAPCKQCIAPS